MGSSDSREGVEASGSFVALVRDRNPACPAAPADSEGRPKEGVAGEDGVSRLRRRGVAATGVSGAGAGVAVGAEISAPEAGDADGRVLGSDVGKRIRREPVGAASASGLVCAGADMAPESGVATALRKRRLSRTRTSKAEGAGVVVVSWGGRRRAESESRERRETSGRGVEATVSGAGGLTAGATLVGAGRGSSPGGRPPLADVPPAVMAPKVREPALGHDLRPSPRRLSSRTIKGVLSKEGRQTRQ